jgi:CBS-domain-containing membrane protein
MRRAESGTQRRRPWWLTAFSADESLADGYIRSHGRKVADVMTRRLVTATPDTPVHVLADLLEKNAVKRVPIVEGRRVVGIVSRANLLQALASLTSDTPLDTTPDDKTLQDRVVRQIGSQPWAHTALVNVLARDGTVDLWGMVDTASEKDAMRIAAENTPGVRAVNNKLVVRPIMAAG